MIRSYVQGWQITYNAGAPVTGRYRAVKHGVSMCAGTYDALVSMIRQRERA